jgi:protocatechuate 3,4-dioxygenase beta subunit
MERDKIAAGAGERALSRRNVIGFGASLGALFVSNRVLVACSSDSNAGSAGDAGTGTDGAGDDLDALAGDSGEAGTGAADAAETSTCEAAVEGADAALPWASGGTASMTAKATYPNPFACSAPSSCTMTCELTAGPCYSSQSVVIQDISYGYAGLPVRMYFQLLNEDCKPVANATIDVWHVSPVGKYSGDDSVNEDISFCTGNDSTFTSALYFRGKQTSDANGIVFFDTCYPGWYSSRTTHVHLTISVGGSAYVTTQLCFDDALDDSIVGAQPLYDTRGARDTKNTTDTVFSAGDYTDYLFETAKMSDGVMLAWKTIVLRNSTSEAICGGSGDGGMGGMMGGGPPGEGGMMGPAPGEGGPLPGFEGGTPPNDTP